MDPSARSQLHEHLREASRAAHRALDRHRVLAPLVRTDLTAAQYGDALAALHGVYAPLEAAIDGFLATRSVGFAYDSRRKLPALDDDLAALGRRPEQPEMGFPPPASLAELVGVLYVVEGSALGGQAIVRCLRKSGLENPPLRFFSGSGARTEALWRQFLDFADASCSPADSDPAARTVVSLFRAIEQHLDDSVSAL
jgi:heme oxygenase